MQRKTSAKKTILLAGVAGGSVEVVWVLLFCLVSPLQASLVAEEVARSFLPQMAGGMAVISGVLIHYALAMLIATVAAIVYLRIFAGDIDEPTLFVTSVSALVLVWACNFFVILPVVNPDFVALMPLGVTLASKIMFGLAMGWAFFERSRDVKAIKLSPR